MAALGGHEKDIGEAIGRARSQSRQDRHQHDYIIGLCRNEEPQKSSGASRPLHPIRIHNTLKKSAKLKTTLW